MLTSFLIFQIIHSFCKHVGLVYVANIRITSAERPTPCGLHPRSSISAGPQYFWQVYAYVRGTKFLRNTGCLSRVWINI